MAFQPTDALFGIIDGRRSNETPGVLVDKSDFTFLAFHINPDTLPEEKTLAVNDRVVPGRHAPRQEPYAGGAEQISLDLIFKGYSTLAHVQMSLARNWLKSLFFPTRGGFFETVNQAFGGQGFARNVEVTQIGRPVSLTYGAWIINRSYLPRKIQITHGPAHHPTTLLPYELRVQLTLQEDEDENIDHLQTRFGVPVEGF